eukprot:CAMPEP_0178713026 /NCGR_PEP_ID=MMETSP0699-20121125/19197_1 /TAXON_ID=265572 /ORGANISM="Extubocellulus spinifer, Strain CCMP396" /LENGTH=133 /DNA_ID=CAMNT_0020361819 /DNA_START=10 /DNA_END=413 /DNA_ORIENTATION=+
MAMTFDRPPFHPAAPPVTFPTAPPFQCWPSFFSIAARPVPPVVLLDEVCDPPGGSNEAEVFIEIEGTNDPPVTEDNSYAATKEQLDDAPTIAVDILDNDSDPDSDNLTIVGVADPDGNSIDLFDDVPPMEGDG